MTERTVPWWRKVLKVAWEGVRTGFGLFSRPAKEEEPAAAEAEEPPTDLDKPASEPVRKVQEEVGLERSVAEQQVQTALKEDSPEKETAAVPETAAAEVKDEAAETRVEEPAAEAELPVAAETIIEAEPEVEAEPAMEAASESEAEPETVSEPAVEAQAFEDIAEAPKSEDRVSAAAVDEVAVEVATAESESEAAPAVETTIEDATEALALEETNGVTMGEVQERMDAEPEDVKATPEIAPEAETPFAAEEAEATAPEIEAAQEAAPEDEAESLAETAEEDAPVAEEAAADEDEEPAVIDEIAAELQAEADAEAEAGAAAAESVAEEPAPDAAEGETGVPIEMAEEAEPVGTAPAEEPKEEADAIAAVPADAESTEAATVPSAAASEETVEAAAPKGEETAGAATSDAIGASKPEPAPAATQAAEAAPAKKLIKLEAKGEDASPFSVLVEEVYDGPLDLLLDLIRKQDIDIYDIPIARITAQFLAYVNRLKASDVDVAGEFIYTASLLIHIKSKMLLPRTATGPEEVAEDPRRELVERLLEHERFKNAAQMLQEKQMLEAATWTNPGVREFRDDAAPEPEIAADTVDLVRVFREILERARTRPVLDVQEDSVTVGQMVQFLSRRLTMEDKPIALRRLLSHTHTERALIAMFLALLEMVRMQAILLRQDKAFCEIFIKKNSGFDAFINQGLTQDDWR